eukprot:m.20120 g.20120  ORF g.20120 m.20120 type:complete len:159 (+) comp12037_c0_seq1:128-604(+)
MCVRCTPSAPYHRGIAGMCNLCVVTCRDEDHCALITELLGDIPLKVALCGEYSSEVFTKKGAFRHIKDLKPWGLESVLRDKYQFRGDDATSFASFLTPMLALDKSDRASAAACLRHPWLQPDATEHKAADIVAQFNAGTYRPEERFTASPTSSPPEDA